MKVDPEVVRAVEETGQTLAAMGHTVEPARVDMGGAEVLRSTTDLFFFGFDQRLEGYAKRSGHTIGPDTLEPVIQLGQALEEAMPWRGRVPPLHVSTL